jgi:CDP-diacylglycerol--serine O-phosphatidyltransferase
VVWVAAAVYLACTLLRLARFGLEAPGAPDPEPGLFWGLPSPAAAAVVASFPIMLYGPQVLADGPAGDPGWDVWAARFLPPAAVAVAGLMVSRVRYRHLLRDVLRKRGSRPRVVKLIFAAAVVVAVPRVVVPLAVCWYAFAPPLAAAWDRARRGRPPATSAAGPTPAGPAGADGR